jgi:hypothetical protein
MKFIMPKNKYYLIISGKGISRHFIPNIRKLETMYDAYWAFVFGKATKIQVCSYRTKKVFKIFNNLNEWKEHWVESYGEHANYWVFADRY